LRKQYKKKGILMNKTIKEAKIVIPIPDFLPEDKRQEFIDLTEKLIARDLLNEMDIQAYNLLWFYYLMCLEAMAKIKEIGLIQKDRHIVRKNPAIQILRDASSQFYKFASQFGLMPVARRNSFYLDIEIPSYIEEDQIS
jgi:P27 family predicted phage terminase small subunit